VTIDPFVIAAIEESFDRSVAAITPCQSGTYKVNPFRWDPCGAPAAPEGDDYQLGRDHDGNVVEARKIRCAAGHWYTEVLG
jgi:hypothetical protein